MKWILISLLFIQLASAETSKVIPVFLEAAQMYVQGQELRNSLFISKEIKAALEVLEKSKINPTVIERFTAQKFSSSSWPLRKDDQYDDWTSSPQVVLNKVPNKVSNEVPEIAVHAVKIDVLETTDDFFKDDVYAYFFITDGLIPTGKVTSIYKGISSGQSFFFNQSDRAIFPLTGIEAKRPNNHLIIDYGIIESDGDDIKEMQQLSSIIIDIAIAVYASYDPQNSKVVVNLRKEIKALADMLISLNHDDRMATGTIAYKSGDLTQMLKNQSFFEIQKKHAGGNDFNTWKYNLSFRFLKK